MKILLTPSSKSGEAEIRFAASLDLDGRELLNLNDRNVSDQNEVVWDPSQKYNEFDYKLEVPPLTLECEELPLQN